jgi:hypothetical protein
MAKNDSGEMVSAGKKMTDQLAGKILLGSPLRYLPIQQENGVSVQKIDRSMPA